MKIKKCDDCAYCACVSCNYPIYGIPEETQSDCIICTDFYNTRIRCIEARNDNAMCGIDAVLFQKKQDN